MLTVGTHVDRYVVEEILGEGGTAIVYRVRHAELGTRHALKVLIRNDLSRRALDEGRIQARLRHPNVVAVTDVFRVGDLPALVMEFIDGPTLDDVLDRMRPTVAQVDALAVGILEGVHAAHLHGIVHRDLKPGNVLIPVEPFVVAKVADFGLARINEGPARTRPGVSFGTPQFMAPEQFRSARDVDARADVFSLGAMLYELATGQSAFGYDDPIESYKAITTERYRDPRVHVPDMPNRWYDAIKGALRADPEERIDSVERMLKIWRGDALIDPIRAWPDDARDALYQCAPHARANRATSMQQTRVVTQNATIPLPDPPPMRANTPTLVPATNVQAPRAEPVSDLPLKKPHGGRVRWAVAAVLAASVVAGIVAVGAVGAAVTFADTGDHTHDVATPTAPVVVIPADPVAPELDLAEAEPATLVDPPAQVEAPRPRSSKPSASTPAPAVQAQPEVPPTPSVSATATPVTVGHGSVHVDGSKGATLVAMDGTAFATDAPIPPGTYTLSVRFDADRATDAMQITVGTDPIRVKCTPLMRVCKIAR